MGDLGFKILIKRRCTHWNRKWQPTPVFFPGESHGQRSPGRGLMTKKEARIKSQPRQQDARHGGVLRLDDNIWAGALKKDSRGLCRGAAGNPRVPRLLPGTLGNFPGCLWELRDPVEAAGPHVRRDRAEMISLFRYHMKIQWENDHLQTAECSHQILDLLVSWSWTLLPLELWEIHFFYLNHSVYGILDIATLIV